MTVGQAPGRGALRALGRLGDRGAVPDIRRRIDHLKGEREKVRVHRQQYRARRKRSRIPVVALVGYTNAGKSTLILKTS